MVSRGLQVVVVDGGVVGASTAWHLARAGARVTLSDAFGETARDPRWQISSRSRRSCHYFPSMQRTALRQQTDCCFVDVCRGLGCTRLSPTL
ncbi:FAD-dependent oxidoreductase [Chelatococcus sp. GCM10030263]|uniref:FAD-dependent oxidoreductase n=1 Tax=Chelatococcus sp. GCM10030263 TaxID=3273387 RepID=UPI00360BD786